MSDNLSGSTGIEIMFMHHSDSKQLANYPLDTVSFCINCHTTLAHTCIIVNNKAMLIFQTLLITKYELWRVD